MLQPDSFIYYLNYYLLFYLLFILLFVRLTSTNVQLSNVSVHGRHRWFA